MSSNLSTVARVLNFALGAWLFISAFSWNHSPEQVTNTWIMGSLCALFAAIALQRPAARWLNVALSIWLFVSVWAVPGATAGTRWNNALVAIAVFILALVPGEGEAGHPLPARSEA